MRAVVQDRYGGPEVLRVDEDAPAPVAGPGRLVVRVAAAAVDRGTWHVLTGTPLLARPAFGIRAPRGRWRFPGRDVAGVVEVVGPGVTGWATGDPVHGTVDGSLAELVVATPDRLTRPPAGVSAHEAAALPISGGTAFQALRTAGVAEGQRVLVVGSSGGVGHLAVQVAVAQGAVVTAVCGPGSEDLARRLGAHHVLVRGRDRLDAEGVRYDVVLDIASNRPRRELRSALAERGTLVAVGTESGGRLTAGLHRSIGSALLSPFVRQRLVMFTATERGSDLAELDGLVASGHVRPVVDRVVPLDRVAEALAHVGAGRARGKVVVDVDPSVWADAATTVRATAARLTPRCRPAVAVPP